MITAETPKTLQNIKCYPAFAKIKSCLSAISSFTIFPPFINLSFVREHYLLNENCVNVEALFISEEGTHSNIGEGTRNNIVTPPVAQESEATPAVE